MGKIMKAAYTTLVITFISFCTVFASAQNAVNQAFLDNYFGTDQYVCKEQPVDGPQCFFAYRKLGTEGIFDKAILFKLQNDSSVRIFLFVTGNRILDANGKLLFTGEIASRKFYGWSMNTGDRTDTFSLNFHTDGGKSVTEGPILAFDKKRKTFTLVPPDRSAW